MMKRPVISPRDLEALSAYLDGQLSAPERRKLESRLKESPDLQQELLALKRTRAILKAAPRRRAPRNFTLTPQMAGVRRGRRPVPAAFPALRLASALAMIFLALVVVGDLTARNAQPAMVAQSSQGNPNLWFGRGGGGGGGGGAEVGIQPQPQAEALVEQTPVLKEGPSIAVTPISPTATPAADAVALAPPAETEMSVQSDQPQETQPVQSIWGGPLLRILQVLLALLAVGAGLGAWLVKRSERF